MKKPRTIYAFLFLFVLILVATPILGVDANTWPLIWEADVPSTGEPESSPVLEAGREYRIMAEGSFLSCDPTFGFITFAADAQYYTLEFAGLWSHPSWWVWTSNILASPSFLLIDGNDVSWGPFSNGGAYPTLGHEYTIFFTGTGAPITFAIADWIDGNDWNFCHIHVEIYEGPPPPRGETAFAYGGDYATCFQSFDFDGDGKSDFKNWGWSNGPLPGDPVYEFEIWAGAPKCDLTKGELVGTLTIDYDGSTAIITYTMDAGWIMSATQLYVGSEPLPRDPNGDYTVSPGQYPYIHFPVADPTSDTYTVLGISGDIYVVAHADVIEA